MRKQLVRIVVSHWGSDVIDPEYQHGKRAAIGLVEHVGDHEKLVETIRAMDEAIGIVRFRNVFRV